MKRLFVSFIALSSAICFISAPVMAYGGTGLFGTTESKSSNLKPFPKWTKVVSRIKNDGSFVEWENLLKKTEGLDTYNKVKLVNEQLNARRYIVDPTNWGKSDYWETLREFFYRNGDCEDYAISKFMTLREAGVPNEQMRIVIVQDQNLRIAHAILAVKINGQDYILDNQIKQMTPANRIYHYKPVYSINESNWWLHKK